MTANVLRAGERSTVLRLRQGYGACTLLALRPSFLSCLFVVICGCFGEMAWWLFCIFLACLCAVAKKNTNVPPNALAKRLIYYRMLSLSR